MRNSNIYKKLHYEFETLEILNVRIDKVTMGEALEFITEVCKKNKKSHVVTINPEFIMQAQKNIEFRNVLNNASLRLPDGIGIIWASKIFGQPLKERVTGVDTVYEFTKIASQYGWKIFFLGAAPGVAELTAKKLQNLNPGLKVAGTYSGSPRIEEEAKICELINLASTDILFVAFGSPNQDLWIARNFNRLNIKLAIGVGGTFDFIAGVAKRAPIWIRNIGFEWLYRLIREPHRWKRMLSLPKFAFRVITINFLNKFFRVKCG